MKIAIVYVGGILLVLGSVIGLLLWIEDNVLVTPNSQSTPAPSLGDQLIFPDGWRPIECEVTAPANNYHIGPCLWVCVKDSVYRYCTPVIVSKVEADSAKDGTR